MFEKPARGKAPEAIPTVWRAQELERTLPQAAEESLFPKPSPINKHRARNKQIYQ
jgi:hypothetical protein